MLATFGGLQTQFVVTFKISDLSVRDKLQLFDELLKQLGIFDAVVDNPVVLDFFNEQYKRLQHST